MYNINRWESGAINIISKKTDVLKFIEEIREFLNKNDFDIDEEFVLIRSEKEESKEQYSTRYTLNDMEIDREDVVEILKTLELKEYSETKLDRQETNPPFLFVFGKIINGKLIYIKTKIQKSNMEKVICVSFHYAERNMNFPYKK